MKSSIKNYRCYASGKLIREGDWDLIPKIKDVWKGNCTSGSLCGTWSVTLRADRKLQVFENTHNKGTTLTVLLAYSFKLSANRVPRKTLGPKSEE